MRLESVPNAIHQAKVAAATLLGAPAAYSEVPWFWSDQYDLKLQIAGLSTGYDEVVLRGDPATRSFAAFYLARGQLLAVDAVNSPREFIAGKKLVANRARIAPDVLRDATVDLAARWRAERCVLRRDPRLLGRDSRLLCRDPRPWQIQMQLALGERERRARDRAPTIS